MGQLRILGCLVHATLPKEGQRKLSPRVKSMINMLHHSPRVSRAFGPADCSAHSLRHAKFDRTVSPGFPPAGTNSTKVINAYSEEDELDTGNMEEIMSGDHDENNVDETIDISLSESDEDIAVNISEESSVAASTVARYPHRNRGPLTRLESYSINMTSMKSSDMPSFKEELASNDRNEWLLANEREMHELIERETFVLASRRPNARVLPLQICFENQEK